MNKMTIEGEFDVDGVLKGPCVKIEVEEHRGVIFMPDDIIAQLNKAWGGYDWTGCRFLVETLYDEYCNKSYNSTFDMGKATHFWQWCKKRGHASQGIMGQRRQRNEQSKRNGKASGKETNA